MIFADPPYFLSNGGITCHAGRMVSVNKGKWDKSRGVKENHQFTLDWLKACQRVLKPDGTIWVSGTTHIIYSVGYAMQELGYKILNDIIWYKHGIGAALVLEPVIGRPANTRGTVARKLARGGGPTGP